MSTRGKIVDMFRDDSVCWHISSFLPAEDDTQFDVDAHHNCDDDWIDLSEDKLRTQAATSPLPDHPLQTKPRQSYPEYKSQSTPDNKERDHKKQNADGQGHSDENGEKYGEGLGERYDKGHRKYNPGKIPARHTYPMVYESKCYPSGFETV